MSEERILYICHPFGSNPVDNANRITYLCHQLVSSDYFPFAPQLLLPHFLDETTERDFAMAFCLRLVSLVDEVRVYGNPTEGMRLEIAEARRLGIPVVEGKIE